MEENKYLAPTQGRKVLKARPPPRTINTINIIIKCTQLHKFTLQKKAPFFFYKSELFIKCGDEKQHAECCDSLI
jgi:hypothetical protein